MIMIYRYRIRVLWNLMFDTSKTTIAAVMDSNQFQQWKLEAYVRRGLKPRDLKDDKECLWWTSEHNTGLVQPTPEQAANIPNEGDMPPLNFRGDEQQTKDGSGSAMGRR